MRKFTFLFLLTLLSLGVWGQCSTTADFTYVYTGCSTIQFTDASTASPNYNLVKWEWDYGDGDTATGPIVSHTFTPGITVNVKLVVTADSSGVTCTDSIVKTIVIHALPTVYAASDHNPSCIVVPAQFFGSSGMEPYINSWQWDFGDGTFDTVQNPAHLYADTGSYQVILHIVDSNECANNDTLIQKVNSLPAMDFSWSVEPAATTDNLQFTATVDTTLAPVTSWHWDFGDGDTSNIQNPTHQYSDTGQYSVTLSIISGGFCPNSLTKIVHVEPLPAPDFTVSAVCLNDTTYFTDSTTTPVGTITTWKWYFGDGDSLIIHSPDNPNVKHIYRVKTIYPVTLLAINSEGYERSITKNITVVPKPLADFTFNDTCYTLPTTFTDQSSLEGGSAITSWNWDFSDTLSGAADSSVLQNPTHIFSLPGTYPVQLIIRNADGCSDTTIKPVVRDTLPTVEFTISKDSVCPGEDVSFYGIATDISIWHWDFGNGDTSQYQNPTYHYSTSGTYTVTLTVTNTNGCTSSVSHTIYVKPQPLTDFTFNIWCQGDTTCFWDQSSVPNGYITEWNWSFGDGDTSTLQNPEHLYQPVGQYYATLSVTSNEGCRNSATHIIIFDSLPSPDFSLSPACMNDTTFFTDKTTTPVGVITTWKWYFGDGDSLIVHDPDSANAKHIYLAQTTYNVTLLTISSFGFERSITKQITVHHKPLANFTFNDTCYYAPISFTDSSTQDGGSALSGWNWNFGDPISGIDNESDLQNPTHIMSHPDTFNVRLIVTNLDGCTDTALREVVVDSVPPVDFTLLNDSICFGENAYFYATGKDITSWEWDFGNGDSSSFQNPVYKYPEPGLYTVTLRTTSLKGCESIVSHKVFIIAPPQADFSIGKSCIGDSTLFTDKTLCPVGYISQWQWDFGDTASSTNQSSLQNPAHRFTSVNGYKVQLITTNNFGCADTVFHYVNVFDKPQPGFIFQQSCDPATEVYFTDTSKRSSSKSPIILYQWNFFQSDSSYLQNPTYRFPDFDSCYQVTLTVTDTNSCSNTDTVRVCLRDSLTINFTAPTVCFNQRTFFKASYSPSSDSIAQYTWDFNDGSEQFTTFHDTISHRFPRPGTYQVTLSATDTNGCSITISREAIVDSLPTPNFIFTTPACDQPTYFVDSSQGNGNFISAWKWDFGDVSSGTENYSDEQNPNHLYLSQDSVYQVKLVVTNFNGCIDSITKPVERHTCLNVFYTANTGTGCANNPIYFRDQTVLYGTTGNITEWYWDFGDGNQTTYNTFTDSIPHTYNKPGNYLVTLRVTANVNNTLFSQEYDSSILVYKPPIAGFSYSPACAGQVVYFTDSTTTFDAPISQWQWTFNDPNSYLNTSSLQNPTHVYDSTGTFPAQLIVTDQHNCKDTASQPVEVYPVPNASFTFTPNANGVTGQVLMNNTSTGASTYFWDFGDGGTSTEENPLYQYSSVGVFHILLVATSQYQCSDSATSTYDLTSGLYVPNSFAPNSDAPGTNIFLPKGIHLKSYQIQIFSSWGTLLWESDKLTPNGEPAEGWDGTYKGKPMPAGTYIWHIKAKFLNDQIWEGSDNGDGHVKPYGTVNLIR